VKQRINYRLENGRNLGAISVNFEYMNRGIILVTMFANTRALEDLAMVLDQGTNSTFCDTQIDDLAQNFCKMSFKSEFKLITLRAIFKILSGYSSRRY